MEQSAIVILPPIITIILALATKEVYMSLIVGILAGTLLFVGGNPFQAILVMFDIMGDKIGSNVNILIFFGDSWNFSCSYLQIRCNSCLW